MKNLIKFYTFEIFLPILVTSFVVAQVSSVFCGAVFPKPKCHIIGRWDYVFPGWVAACEVRNWLDYEEAE
jgi:hypothetical protein